MPLVAWRAMASDVRMASFRLRCLLPALYLEPLGVPSRICAGGAGVKLSDVRALVFVKTFTRDDLDLARQAHRAGIAVILDLCDNVFVDEYRNKQIGDGFDQMAVLATTITTTGPALADVIARRVPPRVPVEIVPDPVESPADVHAAATLLRERGNAACRKPRPVSRDSVGDAASRSLRRVRRLLRPNASAPPAVVWFGVAGTRRPNYGLSTLLDTGRGLKDAYLRHPFTLRVVTRATRRRMRDLDDLPVPWESVPWHPIGVFDEIRSSAVAIVPNSGDEFSACKSANRVAVALAQGTPVVASRTPATDAFEHCAIFDDFATGVPAYLADSKLADNHLRVARGVIEREFSPLAVAHRWREVIARAVHLEATEQSNHRKARAAGET
jgi:hypothetical protein